MCWLSWFSAPGCCSCPGFRLCLGASDCSPWASILLHGPLDICLDVVPALPYHPAPVQKREAQHMFLQHRTDWKVGGKTIEIKIQTQISKIHPAKLAPKGSRLLEVPRKFANHTLFALGISRPMFGQTCVLQPVGLHENDGNHKRRLKSKIQTQISKIHPAKLAPQNSSGIV